MKYIKNILKIIAYIILIFFLGLVCITFVQTDILKKDYVNIFDHTYFVVTTGSMSGTIETNDLIIVKLTQDVKKGEIISFRDKNNTIVTHRVIKIEKGKYYCKGDMNNSMDEPITKNDIIGKVSFIISPKNIAKVIIILIILFIILSLLNFDKLFEKVIRKEIKEKNNSKRLDDSIEVYEDITTLEVPDFIANDIASRDDIDEKIVQIFKMKDDEHNGNTITIPLNEIQELQRELESLEEEEIQDEVEVLDIDKNKIITRNIDREKDVLNLVNNILKIKNNGINTSKINTKWLAKYKYVYKLAGLLLIPQYDDVYRMIEKPTFREIYNYDLEKAGLSQLLRNKIYDMPVNVFISILVYAIMYNDIEFFDGVFKIFRYKVQSDNSFIDIGEDIEKSIKNTMKFMKEVSKTFDDNNEFSLDKIDKLLKIRASK